MHIRLDNMIREMQDRDLEAVLAIEAQAFSSHWTHQQMVYELHENTFAYLYVYEEDGIVLGYIDYWITFDTCQLASVAVSKEARRRGIAKVLMDEMIKAAEAKYCSVISLEVRMSNEPAKSLYQRYGFVEASIRKNYYSDNHEDAILMVKGLGGEW